MKPRVIAGFFHFMKKCSKCKGEKDINLFYKNRGEEDGYHHACKDCEARRDKNRVSKKNYLADPDYHKRAWEKWHLKNGEQFKVNMKIINLIAEGKLERGNCEVCGELKAEAHHCNYRYPLRINWLCKTHHSELHRNLIN